MTTQIETLIANAKAKREAAGLKSTYVGANGREFDMFHPTAEAKAYHDFKYALRDQYGPNGAALVPAEDMAALELLAADARKAHGRAA